MHLDKTVGPCVRGWNAQDHQLCENVLKLRKADMKKFAVRITL